MREPKRTAKDERDYNDHLRRQENIKTEVIVELRAANKALTENQERALTALISTTEMLIATLAGLNNYRRTHLEATKHARENPDQSHCITGCQKHTWDSEHGWMRSMP